MKSKAKVQSSSKIGVTLGVAALVVAAGYGGLSHYLHGESLRQRVADGVGEKIGVPVDLQPLEWSGLWVESAGATAKSDGALQRLKVDGLSLDVATDWLQRESWEVSNLKVGAVEVDLDLTKPFGVYSPVKPPQNWLSKQFPERTVVQDAEVEQFSCSVRASSGDYDLQGSTLRTLRESGDWYLTTLQGGELGLAFDWLPASRLNEVKLRHSTTEFDLIHAKVNVGNEGVLFVEGEADAVTMRYAFQGLLEGLAVASMLDGSWQDRVEGEVRSAFKVGTSPVGELQTTGGLLVENAELHSVPALDTLARFAKKSELKRLRFEVARCDYAYRQGVLRLSNIQLSSGTTLRVRGSLAFQGQETNGVLHVGVNPALFEKIPSLLEGVFERKADGYAWLAVKVEGDFEQTLAKITRQVSNAAIGRLLSPEGIVDALQTGSGLFDSALDPESSKVNQSIEEALLQQPAKAASEVLDAALDSFLGGSKVRSKRKK